MNSRGNYIILLLLTLLPILGLAQEEGGINVNTNIGVLAPLPSDPRDTTTFLSDTTAYTWTFPGLLTYAVDADAFWYFDGAAWSALIQELAASNVTFDTTGTFLDSLNVQGAIEQLDARSSGLTAILTSPSIPYWNGTAFRDSKLEQDGDTLKYDGNRAVFDLGFNGTFEIADNFTPLEITGQGIRTTNDAAFHNNYLSFRHNSGDAGFLWGDHGELWNPMLAIYDQESPPGVGLGQFEILISPDDDSIFNPDTTQIASDSPLGPYAGIRALGAEGVISFFGDDNSGLYSYKFPATNPSAGDVLYDSDGDQQLEWSSLATAVGGNLTSPYIPYWDGSVFQDSPLQNRGDTMTYTTQDYYFDNPDHTGRDIRIGNGNGISDPGRIWFAEMASNPTNSNYSIGYNLSSNTLTIRPGEAGGEVEVYGNFSDRVATFSDQSLEVYEDIFFNNPATTQRDIRLGNAGISGSFIWFGAEAATPTNSNYTLSYTYLGPETKLNAPLGELAFLINNTERMNLTDTTLLVSSNVDEVYFNSTGFVKLPTGTTAQQPLPGRSGALRYNTTEGYFEGDDGVSWEPLAWADLSNVTGFAENNILVGNASGGISSTSLDWDPTSNELTILTGTNEVVFARSASWGSSTDHVIIGGNIGNSALIDNSILIGQSAGRDAGDGGILIGYRAEGTKVSIGSQAGYNTGADGIAIGPNAMLNATNTGTGQIVIGTNAAQSADLESNNTIIGYKTGQGVDGANNTVLGAESYLPDLNTQFLLGDGNTVLGYRNLRGTNNTRQANALFVEKSIFIGSNNFSHWQEEFGTNKPTNRAIVIGSNNLDSYAVDSDDRFWASQSGRWILIGSDWSYNAIPSIQDGDIIIGDADSTNTRLMIQNYIFNIDQDTSNTHLHILAKDSITQEIELKPLTAFGLASSGDLDALTSSMTDTYVPYWNAGNSRFENSGLTYDNGTSLVELPSGQDMKFDDGTSVYFGGTPADLGWELNMSNRWAMEWTPNFTSAYQEWNTTSAGRALRIEDDGRIYIGDNSVGETIYEASNETNSWKWGSGGTSMWTASNVQTIWKLVGSSSRITMRTSDDNDIIGFGPGTNREMYVPTGSAIEIEDAAFLKFNDGTSKAGYITTDDASNVDVVFKPFTTNTDMQWHWTDSSGVVDVFTISPASGRVGIMKSTDNILYSLEIEATDAIAIPYGTDAQQPLAGRSGAFRFNTTGGYFEGDDGVSWEPLAWGSDIPVNNTSAGYIPYWDGDSWENSAMTSSGSSTSLQGPVYGSYTHDIELIDKVAAQSFRLRNNGDTRDFFILSGTTGTSGSVSFKLNRSTSYYDVLVLQNQTGAAAYLENRARSFRQVHYDDNINTDDYPLLDRDGSTSIEFSAAHSQRINPTNHVTWARAASGRTSYGRLADGNAVTSTPKFYYETITVDHGGILIEPTGDLTGSWINWNGGTAGITTGTGSVTPGTYWIIGARVASGQVDTVRGVRNPILVEAGQDAIIVRINTNTTDLYNAIYLADAYDAETWYKFEFEQTVSPGDTTLTIEALTDGVAVDFPESDVIGKVRLSSGASNILANPLKIGEASRPNYTLDVEGSVRLKNYVLNTDQDTTGLDGYVLTYNTATGEIELRPPGTGIIGLTALEGAVAEFDQLMIYDTSAELSKKISYGEFSKDRMTVEFSTNTTANPYALNLADVSAGILTVTPPSNPEKGMWFTVVDSRANSATSNISVDFTTDLLHATSQTYSISTNGDAVKFTYINSTVGWVISK